MLGDCSKNGNRRRNGEVEMGVCFVLYTLMFIAVERSIAKALEARQVAGFFLVWYSRRHGFRHAPLV